MECQLPRVLASNSFVSQPIVQSDHPRKLTTPKVQAQALCLPENSGYITFPFSAVESSWSGHFAHCQSRSRDPKKKIVGPQRRSDPINAFTFFFLCTNENSESRRLRDSSSYIRIKRVLFGQPNPDRFLRKATAATLRLPRLPCHKPPEAAA